MASIKDMGGGRWKITISHGSINGKKRRKVVTYKVDPLKTPKAQAREAERYANAMETDIKRGKLLTGKKITLRQLADEWLLNYAKQGGMAESTIRFNMDLLEGRILPQMGNMFVQDIEPPDINRFLGFVANDKPKSKRSLSDRLSSTYLRKYYTLLHTMFKCAMQWGYISVNPMSGVRAPRIDTKEVQPYSSAQLALVLEALDSDASSMWRAYFYTSIYSQLRGGELIGLDWSAIDFDRGIISVHQAAYYAPGKGTLIKETKTASSRRRIAMPARAMEVLRAHRISQAEQRIKLGQEWVETDAVFTQWNGKRLHMNTPSHVWSKMLMRHNLPHMPPHGLRHTGATLLLAEGNIDVKGVSRRLGHSRASTTLDIYAHAIDEADTRASEALDLLLGQPRGEAK